MRNFVRVAQLALVPGFALIATGMVSVAEARGNLNAHLRGAYAFTGARTCTVLSAPFVGPTFAIPASIPPDPFVNVFRQSASDAGITTFNGDGTGTSSGTSSTMNVTSTGGSPLGLSETTSEFNYTVNPDGTVDTATTTFFSTFFGSGAGNTGTVTGSVGRLQISHGNTMLVSAPQVQVSPETLVITLAVGGQITQYRICVNSRVYTKLPSQ